MRSKAFWIEQLGEEWPDVLKSVLRTEEFDNIISELQFDYVFSKMYPRDKKDIFKPFRLCSWNNLKVVIIGTEPSTFAGTGGLAFSDQYSEEKNPSLETIRQCLSKQQEDLKIDFDYTLEHWASQGVLLLNRSFVCKQGEKNTHKDKWKKFFGTILFQIVLERPGTIFFLWGSQAQKYSEVLSHNQYVFSWEHPMKAYLEKRPWECPNFEQANQILKRNGGTGITW